MVKWPDKNKPYFDLKPVVIPDFFTPSEYEGLYKLVEDSRKDEHSNVQLNEPMGYFAENIYIKEPFYSVMIDKINKHYKLEQSDPEKCAFIYNRYTWKTGHPPTLKPHFDTILNFGMITLTIILNTSLKWNIVVEDEEFEIDTNQALLFAGTHQIHWRPKIEFGPGDYYDFLLCQFVNDPPLMLDDEEYWQKMVSNRAEASTDWWRKYEYDGISKP